MYYIRSGNKNYESDGERIFSENELEIAISRTGDAYYEDLLGPNFDELVEFAELIHKPTGDIVYSIRHNEDSEPAVYENHQYIPEILRES